MSQQEIKKLAQQVVNDWHSKSSNFEREIRGGTPKWLQLARAIAAQK